MTGHAFQSRYGSVVMDEGHLLTAARYAATPRRTQVGRGRPPARKTGAGRASAATWWDVTTAL
ncbi:MAG: hypothetical protein WAL59_30480 [Roseiarcus sp.]